MESSASVGFVLLKDSLTVNSRSSISRLAETPHKGLSQCVPEGDADGVGVFDCFFLMESLLLSFPTGRVPLRP